MAIPTWFLEDGYCPYFILHEIPWDTYLSTSIITHTEGMWEYLGGVAMQANPFGRAGEGGIVSDRNEDVGVDNYSHPGVDRTWRF